MKPLLIISHTPSQNTNALAKSACDGATTYAEGRPVHCYTPLQVESEMLLQASGVILGTTENIGAMAGLTKDMFDRCYYDWLDQTMHLPNAVYVRAGQDGTATIRQLTGIISAMKWQLIQPVSLLKGTWQDSFCDEVHMLAGTMAAGLDAGLYG